MEYRSVRDLIGPLVRGGHDWQFIDINGCGKRPRFYFSGIQWFLVLVSLVVLLWLKNGISINLIGYVMAAFSISVSLFMSLIVSIFDKFENTSLSTQGLDENGIIRLKQKHNFFKRFISITSYLVVLSILVIVLSSFTYLFNLSEPVSFRNLTFDWHRIDWYYTVKCVALLAYRAILNYFLLNYLFLTLFVTGSAYEYYISEMDRRVIE